MNKHIFTLALSLVLLVLGLLSLVTGYAGLIGYGLGILCLWLPDSIKKWIGSLIIEEIE